MKSYWQRLRKAILITLFCLFFFYFFIVPFMPSYTQWCCFPANWPRLMMQTAVKHDSLWMMQALAKIDPRLIEAKDCDGRSPLVIASRYNRLKAAEFLLSRGADPNTRGYNALSTLLCDTVLHRQYEMMSLLIRYHADVNLVSTYGGDTPLCTAAEFYLPKAITILLDHGADPFASGSGRTPLEIAAEGSTPEAINCFLTHGIHVNARDKWGQTPLFFVTKKPVVNFMLAKGAQVNIRDSYGRTPLHCISAQLIPTAEVVAILLAHGANPRSVDNQENTPLHRVRYREVAQLLIQHGALVNARNNTGDTPLHNISTQEMAQVLLAHGADLTARNCKGQTPAQVNSALRSFLQQYAQKGPNAP